jgi:protein-tyrosine phosphatase
MAFSCDEVVDVHTHILPGIDDGPATLAGSLALGRCYARLGITRVICTSHYIPGTAWAASPEIVVQKMAAVQDCFDDNDVAVTLLPGMEIAFHRKLIERLERSELLPLAASARYLVEPTFGDGVDGLLATLEILTARGFGIILAHPERIPTIQEMVEKVAGFVLDHGVEIQLNTGSLLGKFGDDSRRTALRLVELGCVQYLGSDAHDAEARRPPDATEWQELEQIVGHDQLRQWCCVNPAGLVGER